MHEFFCQKGKNKILSTTETVINGSALFSFCCLGLKKFICSVPTQDVDNAIRHWVHVRAEHLFTSASNFLQKNLEALITNLFICLNGSKITSSSESQPCSHRPPLSTFPLILPQVNRIAYLITIKSLPTAEDNYNNYKYKPSKQYIDS